MVTESSFVVCTGIQEIFLVVSGCGPVLQNKQFSPTLKSWNLSPCHITFIITMCGIILLWGKRVLKERVIYAQVGLFISIESVLHSIGALPRKVIFCFSGMLICQGILLGWFSVPFFIIPSAPITTGINILLSFHIVVTSIYRSFYTVSEILYYYYTIKSNLSKLCCDFYLFSCSFPGSFSLSIVVLFNHMNLFVIPFVSGCECCFHREGCQLNS